MEGARRLARVDIKTSSQNLDKMVRQFTLAADLSLRPSSVTWGFATLSSSLAATTGALDVVVLLLP